MEIVEISKFRDGAIMPTKADSGCSGYDLCAWIMEPASPLPLYGDQMTEERELVASQITLNPGERWIVKTGLNINIPHGYEAQIRPRSGLAAREGLTVLNTPGTIDSSYSSVGPDFEIGIILINHGQQPFTISHGDRVAQMVIMKLPEVKLVEVEKLTPKETERTGGLGSTGISQKQ